MTVKQEIPPGGFCLFVPLDPQPDYGREVIGNEKACETRRRQDYHKERCDYHQDINHVYEITALRQVPE